MLLALLKHMGFVGRPPRLQPMTKPVGLPDSSSSIGSESGCGLIS